MIKIIITIITTLLILNFLGTNTEKSEILTIFITDYQIDIATNFALFLVILAILCLILMLYTLFYSYFLLKYRNIRTQNNKFSQTINYISSYITNIGLGNYANSQKALKKINKFIPNHPLNYLLALQNNSGSNTKNLLKTLEKLKNHQDTKDFALQGLAIIAKKNANYQKAEQYLTESLIENPQAINSIKALIDLYFATKNWKKLHDILIYAKQKKLITKNEYEFEQALCYLNLAKITETAKIKEKYIIAAQKIIPTNPAIQILYAESLLNKGKKYTLSKYIKNLWPTSPLPELLDIYLAIFIKKKLQKKFKIIEELIKLNPRGEAAIIKYIKLTLTEGQNLNKSDLLLREYLNHINSAKLYDLAIRFYESSPNNGTENEFYQNLLRENKHYRNYLAYICSDCAYEHQIWQESCNNCQKINSLKYNYAKPLALIKMNNFN